MLEDVLKGKWKQCRTELHDRWDQLSADDLDETNGKRDKLVLLFQNRYGFAHRRAEKEVDQFLTEFEDKLRKAS